jgi:hypothetical protein
MEGKNKNQISQYVQKIKNIYQQISIDKMSSFINKKNVNKRVSINPEHLNKKSKISMIVGDFDFARFHFTIHFNDSDAFHFLNGRNRKAKKDQNNDFEKETLENFMREFLKLSTDGFKQVFENAGNLIPTFSLPIITRASDVVFFEINEEFDKTLTIKDTWEITLNHSNIYCQLHFEIYDSILFFKTAEKIQYNKTKVTNEDLENTNTL